MNALLLVTPVLLLAALPLDAVAAQHSHHTAALGAAAGWPGVVRSMFQCLQGFMGPTPSCHPARTA